MVQLTLVQVTSNWPTFLVQLERSKLRKPNLILFAEPENKNELPQTTLRYEQASSSYSQALSGCWQAAFELLASTVELRASNVELLASTVELLASNVELLASTFALRPIYPQTSSQYDKREGDMLTNDKTKEDIRKQNA